VLIGHSVLGTNITAGIAPGLDGQLGTADDIHLPLSSSIISRISSIVIRGGIDGTADNATDSFGIFAQEVGALSIGGHKQHLVAGQIDTLDLGTTGDVQLREFA
jgi:hypothetical protein